MKVKDKIKALIFSISYRSMSRINDYEMSKIIIKSVSIATGINPELLHKKTRKSEIVLARHCVFYHIRNRTKLSLAKIGRIYDKDHATVLNSCRVYNNMFETNRMHKEFMVKIRHVDLHCKIVDAIENYIGNNDYPDGEGKFPETISNWDKFKTKYNQDEYIKKKNQNTMKKPIVGWQIKKEPRDNFSRFVGLKNLAKEERRQVRNIVAFPFFMAIVAIIYSSINLMLS